MVSSFPLIKLISLAMKQISKPLANKIKNEAIKHKYFRNYFCLPPAQFYHLFELNIKRKLLNLGKAKDIPKLNEKMGIELGAELLGEFIIFGVAALTLFMEYNRQSRKQMKEAKLAEERWKRAEAKAMELEQAMKQNNIDLNNLINSIKLLKFKLSTL